MRTYIANTDHGWYQFLSSIEDIDEVNFWRPHGATPFKALSYGKCAVTGEKSLPALEASHIIPYSEGGKHEIPNGLLLRADIHRLFDRGYVTVTPDLRFRVSSRLMDEYHNGRQYYDLENRRIWTPGDPRNDPDHEALEYHSSSLFMH